MCKRLANGTYRYCPSRRPGARSAAKKAARAVATTRTTVLAQALPTHGATRSATPSPATNSALANHARQWIEHGMDDTDFHFVRNYTDSTFSKVNGPLRHTQGVMDDTYHQDTIAHSTYAPGRGEHTGNTRHTVAETVAGLDRALAACPRTPEPHVVYRGCKPPLVDGKLTTADQWVDNAFPEGGNVVFPAYSSTTTSPEVGAGFSSGGVLFEISTTQGSYVEDFALYKGEHEVLLRRNTRFKVVSVQRDVEFSGGSTVPVVVQLAEVEDDPDDLARAA